jgi:hypothetical protein
MSQLIECVLAGFHRLGTSFFKIRYAICRLNSLCDSPFQRFGPAVTVKLLQVSNIHFNWSIQPGVEDKTAIAVDLNMNIKHYIAFIVYVVHDNGSLGT